MLAVEEEIQTVSHAPGNLGESRRFGPVLAFAMGLVVLLNGVQWAVGFRPSVVSGAVELGVAHAETRRIGEVGDDLIRKAIQTQRDTLPFWTTLAALGDFLAEPLALAFRALGVATAFSALAALVGRPVRYDRALAECAGAQGFWVLGLAVRVGLGLALGRTDVETSPALLLPAGTYPAALVLALRQLDPFVLLGWFALARGAWRRGEANLVVALLVCGFLWCGESATRLALGLFVGSAMRLDVMPEVIRP